MRILLIHLIFTFLSVAVRAQQARLDSTLTQIMAQNHIAGLAACTISKGEITWNGYYGYQNIAQHKPVTKETLFMVASTSKIVTTAALMQLHGAGKFKMTDAINAYLPFKVANPNYPTIPITFGQLLRHRSAIQDNMDYLGPFWSINEGDPKIPLAQFLKDYLSANGKHYNKEKNFYPEKPDSAFHYSNVGFALVGYLVERIAGMPFDQYCRKNLFEPLHMDHTAWYLKDVDTNQVAMPYHYSDSLQRYLPRGHGGYPDYPAGQLRTSAKEFAHFLIGWTQQGKYANQQVIPASAVGLITPTEANVGFYTWFQFATERGNILYSHDGGDNGIRTFICFDPLTKKGAVFLMNSDQFKSEALKQIINTVYDKAP